MVGSDSTWVMADLAQIRGGVRERNQLWATLHHLVDALRPFIADGSLGDPTVRSAWDTACALLAAIDGDSGQSPSGAARIRMLRKDDTV
jgi:hypothetical protein